MKRNSRNNKVVRVEASGGLGNQLFIYCAGRYLSEIFQQKLEIELAPVGLSGQIHGISIDKLGLKGDFIFSQPPNSFMDKFKFRIEYFLTRKSQLLRLLINKFGNTYYAKGIGFDEYLGKEDRYFRIRGYFQTWKYFHEIEEKVLNELRIINPTSWYIEMQDKFKDIRPIIMHLRLGDYLNHSKTFGILGSDYYLQAIENLPLSERKKEIWIFSDNVDQAKELLGLRFGHSVNWVQAPIDSPPEESLLLMSLGSVNIIGNSTFSWWGAALNTNKPIVIAPQNWFRRGKTPVELFPSNWILIDNQWK